MERNIAKLGRNQGKSYVRKSGKLSQVGKSRKDEVTVVGLSVIHKLMKWIDKDYLMKFGS